MSHDAEHDPVGPTITTPIIAPSIQRKGKVARATGAQTFAATQQASEAPAPDVPTPDVPTPDFPASDLPESVVSADEPGQSYVQPEKDQSMTDNTIPFTTQAHDAVASAQSKAKSAFDKGAALVGEAGEFARGNAEAIVESSKILAAGVQDLGTGFVAESRSAFDTLTSDLKELAAAKTPADFVTLQSEIVRKQFDSVVAHGSKTSEALLKLTTEVFAPLSKRVSLAVEKARLAA